MFFTLHWFNLEFLLRGIGLTKVVKGQLNFLHDERARTLMRLSCGMEVKHNQVINYNYVKKLSKEERDALIKFVESLSCFANQYR